MGRYDLVKIKKFNPDNIKPDYVINFNGKRGSGKTNAMKNLLYTFRHRFSGASLFSETEFANKSFGYNIPSTYISKKYKPDVVHRIIKKQASKLSKLKNNDLLPPYLILLEDLNAHKKIIETDVDGMIWIMKNGRHLKTAVWLTTQKLQDSSQNIREQYDLIFLF
ncbi:MAG: hypothetical protein KDK45_25260, partial [Leptospiraceae bacterium]|nr:hypothetical protein [Leptospiraceae bacterium]